MEITIETTRIFVTGGVSSQVRAWCARCDLPVHMITLEQAATVMGMNLATVCCRVETGEIHLREMPGEQPRVCLNSLLEST
jgi:hypothetical protein